MKRFSSCLKNHLAVFVTGAVLCLVFLWILIAKIMAPGRDEQVNFAITAYAHHDDGRDIALAQALEPYGIEEVNISCFDISDPERVSEYLLTYGYHMADIFVLDTKLGPAILKDCFHVVSEDVLEKLSRLAGFGLEPLMEGDDVIGILVHKAGDDAYNSNLPSIHQWLLFSAEGNDHDYAVFINVDSVHNDDVLFDSLAFVLQ